MPYVYSTLSCNNQYSFYKKDGNDLPYVERSINIKGGANVATRFDGVNPVITTRGAHTLVTDEELELLLTNPVFKMHVKNGFITYDTKKKSIDKAIEGMQAEDKSAPLTLEKCLKDSGGAQPREGTI